MNRWYPREPTRNGGFLPPRTGPYRYGGVEATTAARRHQDRIDDKVIASRYIQLAPGLLVVWDRQPWRIVETAERPIDLWDEKYNARFDDDVARWDRYPRGERPEKATWTGRPVAIVIVPDGKPAEKPLHLIGPASHMWDVLPEHYAICSACGELPPCRHEEAERAADSAVAIAEVLMDIPPGHCLGCGEQITSRQKAHRYPGPNLWRPDLADGSAVFHARKECAEPAERYRTQFEASGGKDQTALTFDDTTT